MFGKKDQNFSTPLHECKLCGREVPENLFSAEMEICHACVMAAQSFLENYFKPYIDEAQKKVNAATDADTKIFWLAAILSCLYEYKIKYVDKDVQLIDQDVDELIDSIIDNISRVRTEDFPQNRG